MKTFIGRYYQPLILIALSFVFYWAVFTDLVSDWYHDQNYSHGFLIPPISVILFYIASRKFEKPHPDRGSGLALIGASMIILILGTAGAEYFTSRVSFIILLCGIAIFSLGWRNFRKAWFAFFFLLFMVPIPNILYTTLTIPLQLFASKVTLLVLHTASVPSYLHGNIIFLPGYPLEVTEACSGLRSLFSLMALGVLVGYLTLKGFWPVLVLTLMAIPVAVAANIIRIFSTAIISYTVSPKIAESFLHTISGILVFIVALLMILILRGAIAWLASRNRS